MKSGVFIERDVMLNLATRGGQQKTPFCLEEFCVNEAALVPLQRLKSAGFLLLATTNQPEISRGNLSRRELDLMHTMLRARLPIDEILVCPHDEADHCPCRKPRPGLLLEASFKWHLELGHCFVIGHRWQDA
jgi:D-glycero-D-manno-heptose 1,7-bisphosphate phosphatase